MQTIVTKYHGPTNRRGSRVSATASGGTRIYLDWDDRLNSDANHAAAVRALAKRLEWTGDRFVGGALPGGKGALVRRGE